jgi:hypothetical protein
MMTTTPQANITLLQAAQAQKHVTANEAFMRLDALLQLNVISGAITTPPGSPAEGDKYIVPTGATGAWAGQTNKVALRLSGGWVFFTPRNGWLGWNAALGSFVSWDGTAWVTLSLSSGGGSVTVKDEGTTLTTALTTLDFTGTGVTVTNVGGVVTVTIPAIAGPTGPAGADGADGADGAPGATGPAGADGADGVVNLGLTLAMGQNAYTN